VCLFFYVSLKRMCRGGDVPRNCSNFYQGETARPIQPNRRDKISL